MANYCSNCGTTIASKVAFCPQCGTKLDIPKSDDVPIQDEGKFQNIAFDLPTSIKNNQASIANKSLVIFFVFMLLTYLPLNEGNPISGHWAIAFIGAFGMISALVIFFVFLSRSKKMKSLLNGKKLIASWHMSTALKSQYVNHLFERELAKNKVIFFITSTLIILIFGSFILFIDEGKMEMGLTMIALLLFIGTFAFAMPHYYKRKNTNADGNVLIGKNFAYINGFFHNWDFPLSGIKNTNIINDPFYGIYIQYYYTDRTFTNTEELRIPAPKEIDLIEIINGMKK